MEDIAKSDDLFLLWTPKDVEVAWLFRPTQQGTWDFCKRPPVNREKAKTTLRCGPQGWFVQDETAGHKASVLHRPTGDLPKDLQMPPLGTWKHVASGGQCILTDKEPVQTLIDDPLLLQAPFMDVRVSDFGDEVRIEASLNRTPITDSVLDGLLKRFRELLAKLVKRPRVILMLQLSMLDAAVPSMRHVKQFLNFVGENTHLLDMLVRGVAIVLKPQGFTGHSLLHIVKMVLRLLPPPWQTTTVPTVEEGRAFLDRVRAVELKVVAAQPRLLTTSLIDVLSPDAKMPGSDSRSAVSTAASNMKQDASPFGDASPSVASEHSHSGRGRSCRSLRSEDTNPCFNLDAGAAEDTVLEVENKSAVYASLEAPSFGSDPTGSGGDYGLFGRWLACCAKPQ